MRPRHASALALWLSLATPAAWAEVLHQAEQGFVIRHVVSVNQTSERAYAALTHEVGQWWSSAHSYSGDAANFSIDARAGGCFCERWSNGEVQHMQVVFATPPSHLRMIGGLGPLQQEAVAGVMDWQLEQSTNDEAEVTQITLHYRVSGYREGGMASWAAPVNQVLGEQIARLKQYLEHEPDPRPVER